MIQQNTPCDPALHDLCVRLARSFTDIVKPLLRQEEVPECMREAYLVARQILDKPPTPPEV
jgi:hypothetical protein